MTRDEAREIVLLALRWHPEGMSEYEMFVFAGCNLPEFYARRFGAGGTAALVLPSDIIARIRGQAPLLEAMRALEAEGVLARQEAKYRLATSPNR